MIRKVTSGAIAFAALILVGCSPADSPAPAETAEGHFHPKGKPPSEYTIAKLEQARTELPFADRRDFEEQEEGFMAAPESKEIMAHDFKVLMQNILYVLTTLVFLRLLQLNVKMLY